MRKAAKTAKTDKAAHGKAEQVLRKWLSVGKDTPVGRFRDPARG